MSDQKCILKTGLTYYVSVVLRTSDIQKAQVFTLDKVGDVIVELVLRDLESFRTANVTIVPVELEITQRIVVVE